MTNLLFYVLPVILGVLITVFVLNSYKLSSQSGSSGSNNSPKKRSYRFGSGEFFDPIAEIYDVTNRIMTCGYDVSWRKLLIDKLNIQSSDKVLDLATGTADIPLLMLQSLSTKSNNNNNSNIVIHGLDPSKQMLVQGQIKINLFNQTNHIKLHYGNSENMQEIFPLNHEFDVITMSFGIRNVEFKNKTFLEMKRLLKKGGRVGIMEFSAPQGGVLKPVATVFISYILPYLASGFSILNNAYHSLHDIISSDINSLSSSGNGATSSASKGSSNDNVNYIQEYTYLKDSIYNFPKPQDFKNLLLSVAEFESCEVINAFQYIVYIYICKV